VRLYYRYQPVNAAGVVHAPFLMPKNFMDVYLLFRHEQRTTVPTYWLLHFVL